MDKLTTLFKALSDEIRLRILKLLAEGELCVCDIVAALEMAQPKVSFHLGVLREAGLIRDRRQGRWACYRLDESDTFRRFLTLSIIERIPAPSVAADARRLKEYRKSIKGERRPVFVLTA